MTRFLLDQGLPRSAAALLQRLWPKIAVAMSGGAMVTVTRGAVRIKHLPVER